MRVMVPPEGMGVDGVKASVMGTGDLQATRSDDAMLKNTEEAALVGAVVVGVSSHNLTETLEKTGMRRMQPISE